MRGNVQIDSKLERASTIPSCWYFDPEILAREQRSVFGKTWQLAAHESKLARKGDFVATEVAGEPVLLVHDGETRRALSNVCRHRAGPVACGEGNKKSFQCGYHGWNYALDGRLQATPEFDGVENFDKSRVRLPEWRLESWGPFLFVNLESSAPALAAWLPEVVEKTKHVPFSEMRFLERREYVIDCNWKVYVDNYLEGYHIPIVHPQLFKELDYSAYRTETFESSSLQHAPIRTGTGPDRRYANPDGEAGDAFYFWVFPNVMLNIYLDSVSTNLIVPLSPEKTLTIFEFFFKNPELPGTKERIRATIDFSDEIQQEDIRICQAVQRGLRSRTYDRGRYSVRRESGVHHFHRLLAHALGDRGGPPLHVTP
jgi:choline monooxygenase